MRITVEEFESICKIQCTKKDLAAYFDCSEAELEEWVQAEYNEPFETVYEKKVVEGKVELRRAQFKLAEKNAGMAMWLGKQYLNQSGEVNENNGGAQVTNLADIRKKLKMIE